MLIYLLAYLLTAYFCLKCRKYLIKFNNLKDYLKANKEEVNILKQYKSFRRKIVFSIVFLFILAIIPLTFVSGFRYDVGTDYMFTYSPNFYRIMNGERVYTELGFEMLNKVLGKISKHDTILFFTTSFIFVSLLIKIIVFDSKRPILSLVISFITCLFFSSMNNVRQSIAAVIMLCSYKSIINNQFWKFLSYLFLALLFHYSILIMVPFYFFVNFKTIRKNFLKISCLIIILMPLISKLLIFFIMKTKYYYFFVSHFNNGRSNTVNILYNGIFLVIFYFILLRKAKEDKIAHFCLCSQYITFLVAISSIFIPVSELVSRITVYFSIFQVLTIPYVISYIKINFNRKAFLWFYLSAYSVYFVYFILIKGYFDVLPYNSIFGI